MTPPAPIVEEPSPSAEMIHSLRELFAHLEQREEETRAALSDVTARLDELLGRSEAALPWVLREPKLVDAATRHQEYEQSTQRLREAVQEVIPPGANVLVISKGDDALLRMGGLMAQHFPQGPDGRYAGFHPADSAAALAELERLAGKGAEYLVIPASSLWWLDHYGEFAEHLSDAFIFRDDTVGAVCALQHRKVSTAVAVTSPSALHFYTQLRAVVRHLLPPKSRLLVISKGDPELVDFDGLEAAHFPQSSNGVYAGFHPQDGAAAVANLEEMRADGAEYLLIPQSSGWWLEAYPEFRAYLENHARLISRQRILGTLYTLTYGQA